MIQFFPNEQTFVLFKLGNFVLDIRWYAVLILTGALLTYYFCRKLIKEYKYIDLDFFDNLFIYTLWVGIIGARLWFCIFYDFSYYFSNPIEIIKIWDGGLAIQGGLFAGFLFAYFYSKKHGYSILTLFDLILPNVLLGQALGRWGNFVNKECHGAEVAESYFNGFLSFLKKGMYIDGHYYEPLFFYESVLCLIGWIIIYFFLRKNQNKRGDLGYAYLMWYGVIRFFIEQRRTDSLYLGNFKMAQITSLVFVIIGILGYIGILDRFIKKEKPTLVFDFDGTLIDTKQGIIEGYKALFKKYSDIKKFDDDVKEEILGPALRDLFPKYFPGIDYDELYETYRKRQNTVSKKSNKPNNNCVELLKELHEDGYKIAILSTRKHNGIQEILDTFELSQYVDVICGLDDVTNSKPNPEGIFKIVGNKGFNKEVVMIGDSLMDINCGKNYGAYTIAYCDNDKRFKTLSPIANKTISDLIEIKEILKEDINSVSNNK